MLQFQNTKLYPIFNQNHTRKNIRSETARRPRPCSGYRWCLGPWLWGHLLDAPSLRLCSSPPCPSLARPAHLRLTAPARVALSTPSPFKPYFPAWACCAAAGRHPAGDTPQAGGEQRPRTEDSLALLPTVQVRGAHGRQPSLSAPLPACCWPWGQAARLRQALATSRLSTGLGVSETESGPQGSGERRN